MLDVKLKVNILEENFNDAYILENIFFIQVMLSSTQMIEKRD